MGSDFKKWASHHGTRTANGYDANGYDVDGYDVDGYDANGYDVNGYDIDGNKKQSAGYKIKRKEAC